MREQFIAELQALISKYKTEVKLAQLIIALDQEQSKLIDEDAEGKAENWKRICEYNGINPDPDAANLTHGPWDEEYTNPDANPLIEPTRATEDFVDAMYEEPFEQHIAQEVEAAEAILEPYYTYEVQNKSGDVYYAGSGFNSIAEAHDFAEARSQEIHGAFSINIFNHTGDLVKRTEY